MKSLYLLSLASLAPLLGSAFLIPETISSVEAVPVFDVQFVNPTEQFVKLPCPSCPSFPWQTKAGGKTAIVRILDSKS